MLINKVAQAHKIIIGAVAEYNPSSVWVSYSGGKDSAVVLDLYAKLFNKLNVFVIDTQLASDGWITTVYNYLNTYKDSNNLTIRIYHGAGWEWYKKQTLQYGFGYTPSSHVLYFRMLKERAIMTHLREHKTKWSDRVVYLTGVRRSESTKRANTPETSRTGAKVIVNPIVDFSRDNVEHYLTTYCPSFYNPKYIEGRDSGLGEDCNCGWTNKVSTATLCRNSPSLGSQLRELEREVVDSGLWPYNSKPTDEWGLSDMIPTEEMPADSFCVNCYNN